MPEAVVPPPLPGPTTGEAAALSPLVRLPKLLLVVVVDIGVLIDGRLSSFGRFLLASACSVPTTE